MSRQLSAVERSWLLRAVEEEKKKLGVRRLFVCIIVVFFLVGVVTVVTTVPKSHRHHQPPPPWENYTGGLQAALQFFEEQQSTLKDGGDIFRDLRGGYYDAGDATKSTSSMSFSMAMLSWSVIEYGFKYRAAGEFQHVRDIIKWGTDYLLKTVDTNEIVLQVGSPNDQYCWMPPEDINYQRKATQCFIGCADIAAEMAASLASASIVFKDNKHYSLKLLRTAVTVHSYAESMIHRTTDSSKLDEIIWSATWLYYATGNVTYLDRATSHILADRAGDFSRSYVFSSDNKIVGTQLLLTRLRLLLSPGYPAEDVLRQFHSQTSRAMCSYLPYFHTFNRTNGLIRLGYPQPLQYAANAAFLAALYSDYLDVAGIPGWYCGSTFYRTHRLREFSKSQIDYILGKNRHNISFVVGFGDQFPRHVHHRGASVPPDAKPSCEGGWQWRDTSAADPNILIGAMVGGPDQLDRFEDVRRSANYTEPTLAGNAGLVAALVALSESSAALDRGAIFSALPPAYQESPPPPAPWTP